MFHYRWYYAPDRIFGTHWVTSERAPGKITAKTAEAAKAFHDRQVGRMALVGCTETTKPVIEQSYARVLAALPRPAQRLCGARSGRACTASGRARTDRVPGVSRVKLRPPSVMHYQARP
jgi:hypothetical protein